MKMMIVFDLGMTDVRSQVASSTAGLTIGTSPYDDSLKRRKKGVAVAVNRPAIASYVPYLDIESRTFVRDLLVYGEAGKKPIDPLPFIQRLSLSLAVTINWGVRIPTVEDPMFREIVAVEEELNRFRSTTGNLQDYIPLLRLNPVNMASALAREMRDRRDAYLHRFNTDLKAEVEKGTNRPCIQASVITYKEAALTETELTSISLSMLGGGFETVSTTVQWSVGYFAQHPHIQDRAFEAIREFQGGAAGGEVDPLPDAADEQKCAYINALAKEALRYFTVIPLNLPRESIRDVEYEGVRIPKGTTVYMNAWACNYGESSMSCFIFPFPSPDLESMMLLVARDLATLKKNSSQSPAELTSTCHIRPGTMGGPGHFPPRALAREARRAALHIWARVQDVRGPPPGRQGGVPHLHAAAGELQARAGARDGARRRRPGERVQEPAGPDHGAQRVRGALRAEG